MMLNKETPYERKTRFHGFWLERGKSKQFRRKAKKDGGITAVLRRLVAEYLQGTRPAA